MGNSGALSGAFLVVVFCRLWSILVLFLVLLGRPRQEPGGGVGRPGQALVGRPGQALV